MSFAKKEFKQLVTWYQSHHKDYPWRQTQDPYAIWISEIMLQQTRIEAVLPKYERFLKELPTIHDLALVDEDKLLHLWQGLGYYSRARNLKKAAIQIEENFSGIFPKELEDIQSLAGIGDYTSAAIASFSYGANTPAIDGNVLRVLARFLELEQNVLDPLVRHQVYDLLKPLYPASYHPKNGDFNQAIMELGEQICLPKKPKCPQCPIQRNCQSYQKGRQEELPLRLVKTKKKLENHTFILLESNDSILIHQRPEDGLLAKLYEPVNLEEHLEEAQVLEWISKLGLKVESHEKLSPSKHIFSHRIWNIEAYRCLVKQEIEVPGYQWIKKQKIGEYAFSSALDPYRIYFN